MHDAGNKPNSNEGARRQKLFFSSLIRIFYHNFFERKWLYLNVTPLATRRWWPLIFPTFPHCQKAPLMMMHSWMQRRAEEGKENEGKSPGFSATHFVWLSNISFEQTCYWWILRIIISGFFFQSSLNNFCLDVLQFHFMCNRTIL